MVKLIDKYREKITGIEKEHGKDITNFFINTLISFKYLKNTYGLEEFENYGDDLFIDLPKDIQEKLINNIKIIHEVISETLPGKYAEIQNYIINRFVSNYWVQKFLLDGHWQELPDKTKNEVLKDIFENIFSEFEGKDIAIIDDEDYKSPLSTPWTDIPYPIILFDENYKEYERQVLKVFTKNYLLPANKIDLKPSPDKVRNRTDQLNVLLKLSNKNKNYRNKLLFIDAYRLDSYAKLKKIFDKINKKNAVYEDLLAHFYWFEFRRNILWNSTFFLKTRTFLEFYNSIIKGASFEAIRKRINYLSEEQIETGTKKILSLIEDKTIFSSLSIEPVILPSSFKKSIYHTQREIIPLGVNVTFGKLAQEKYSAKGSFEIADSNNNLLNIFYDIEYMAPKWSESVPYENIKIIFDHSDILSKREKTINDQFIEKVNDGNLFAAFNYLSNKNLKEIKPYNEEYRLSVSSGNEKGNLINKYLYDLQIFNYELTKIVLEYHNVNLKEEEFYSITSNNYLIKPISTEWFIFRNNDHNLVKKSSYIQLKNYPSRLVKIIKNYLQSTLGNNEQEKSTLYIEKIEPIIFYKLLECELIVNKASLTELFIKSFFQYIITDWRPKLNQVLVRFYQENRKYILLEKYSLDYENDILKYFDAWLSIINVNETNSEEIKLSRKDVWKVESITPKFAILDFIDNSEKANVFSAISKLNQKMKWKNKALKYLKESGKWESGKRYYEREIHIYSPFKLFNKAKESALKLLEIDPDNIKSYKYLANIYRHLEKYLDEIKVYQNIIEKFPDKEEETLINIVTSYILLEDFGNAEKIAKTLIKKFPDKAQSLGALSSVYRQSKQYDREINIHLKALSKFPDLEKQILPELITAYLFVENFDKAEESALKLLEIDPDNMNSYAYLASVYRQTKKYSDEIRIHQNIIEKFPDREEEALYNCVAANYFLEDFVKVEEFAQLLIKKFPDTDKAQVLGALASVYRQNKQYDEEINIHLKALSKFSDLEKQILPELITAYLLAENFDKAEESALKLLEIDPDNINSYAHLANFYRQSKRYSDETRIHQNIIEKFPDREEEALSNSIVANLLLEDFIKAEELADLLIKKFPDTNKTQTLGALASVCRQKKQYDEEIDIYLKALSKFPDLEKQILPELITAYLLAENFDKAEESALKLLEIDPDNINSYVYLASVYRQTKRYSDEIRIHQNIIEKFPDEEEETLINIINAYILLEDFGNAEKVAKTLIKKFPDKAQSLGALSSVYRQSKQYDREINIHLKALSKFPDLEKQILPELITAYLFVENFDKAEESALKLLEIDPDNMNSYVYLASVYRQTKRYSDEIRIHQNIIEKFPNKEEEPLINIINAYILLEDFGNAEKVAKTLIKKFPDKSHSLGTLSSVYRQSKQYDREINIHLKALSKFPDLEKQILPELITAYLFAENFDKAEKSALRLLNTDKDNIEPYKYLANVYHQANKYEEAIKTYQDIIEKFPDKKEEALTALAKLQMESGI